MVHRAFGVANDITEGREIFIAALGKQITHLMIVKNIDEDDRFKDIVGLKCIFSDSSGIVIYDGGQNCCEQRFMTIDDDLSYFVGAELWGIDLRDAPNIDDEDGVHEVQFVIVTTSKGSFTIASHNEHDGHYGGFDIGVKWMEDVNAS